MFDRCRLSWVVGVIAIVGIHASKSAVAKGISGDTPQCDAKVQQILDLLRKQKDCLPGATVSDIVHAIEASGKTVVVTCDPASTGKGSETSAQNCVRGLYGNCRSATGVKGGGGGDSLITWKFNQGSGQMVGDPGGCKDTGPLTSLGHELIHAYHYAYGDADCQPFYDANNCPTPGDEPLTLATDNSLRRSLGMCQRSGYNDRWSAAFWCQSVL